MRECLGWISSCTNEQSCPQNWLEHAVTEIPLQVGCHVCGQEVSLVITVEALEAEAAQGGLAAFPVVPPIAFGAATGGGTGLPLGGGPDGFVPVGASSEEGSGDGSVDPFDHAEEDPARLPDSIRQPTPVPVRRQWVCTLASGETIRVDKDSMVIGRSRTCDIVIPSAKVSRQHASITFSGGELWIEDLGSANGVWHDGEKVTRTKVAHGDTFTISDEVLRFEVR